MAKKNYSQKKKERWLRKQEKDKRIREYKIQQIYILTERR